MSCVICSGEGKLLNCRVGAAICSKCCFKISSGDPQALRKLKELKKIMKDEVLRLCADCTGIKKD